MNNELDQLSEILEKLPLILVLGSRIVIISFHSLEDRLVKSSLRKNKTFVSRSDGMTSNQFAFLASMDSDNMKPKIYLKPLKKIKPSGTEIDRNKRSRSAILRVAEVISENVDSK